MQQESALEIEYLRVARHDLGDFVGKMEAAFPG